MKTRFAFALLSAAAIAACSADERLSPSTTTKAGSAQPQELVSTSLPADLQQQAREALARDAFRRQHRFLDAVQPGHQFQATRVPQAEIEAGAWSPGDLFQLGGQLFNLTFTRDVGFGARDLPPMARFHTGRRGGPDATRCAACHWRGGPAGGGDGADAAYLDGDGNSQASALARNPIALPGDGFVEILAAEMNAELAQARDALVAQAKQAGAARTAKLRAKGVSFGELTARADGSLDTAKVTGVDADLVIKPFGWKGNLATLRDAVEDALLIHHGMQSEHLVAHAPKERVGPYGGDDPDGDGVAAEITEGQVTALTLFVAMQETPVSVMPPDPAQALTWADGQQRFQAIGCAACHVPALPLTASVFSLPGRAGGAGVSVDLAASAAEPRLSPSAEDGKLRAYFYSDLARHDLGPDLAEPRADRGVAGQLFLTRPLWGVARSGPYLHDGRAATLEVAILAHGGEAQASRDAYAALADPQRGAIRTFLTSLTRARRLVTQ